MVSYKPLWKLLIDKNMTKHDLVVQTGISPNTMTKLNTGEEVSLTVLGKICKCLGVSYGGIIDYTANNK